MTRTDPRPSAPSAPPGEGSGRLSFRHLALHRMPRDEADRWLAELGEVVRGAATPDLPVGGWAADRWEARAESLRGVDGYVALHGGRAVGFVLNRVFPSGGRRALQLYAYVLPEYQGRGLAASMNARIVFHELAHHPVASHYLVAPMTAPIALRGWRTHIATRRDFFPRLAGSSDPRPSLVEAAERIAAEQFGGHEFDPSTGVLRGVTPPRDRTPAPSGDASIDRLFRDHVNAESGDTVLMVVDASRRQVAASVVQLLRAAPRAMRTRSRS